MAEQRLLELAGGGGARTGQQVEVACVQGLCGPRIHCPVCHRVYIHESEQQHTAGTGVAPSPLPGRLFRELSPRPDGENRSWEIIPWLSPPSAPDPHPSQLRKQCQEDWV